MAKKEKRISINAFERVAKENFPETTTIDWHGINVTINHTISLAQMLEFSIEIVEVCFTESGDFMPEVLDFIVKAGVLTRYANFTLPENAEKQYWLVYNTDAVKVVTEHINREQLNEIISAANMKISYLCNSDVVAIRAKITELFEGLATLQEQTGDAFGGLSNDDVQRLIAASQVAETLSEEKIVEAYIGAIERKAAADNGVTSTGMED